MNFFLIQERSAIIEQYLPIAQTWIYEDKREVANFISLMDNTVGGLFVEPSNSSFGNISSNNFHSRLLNPSKRPAMQVNDARVTRM